MDPTVAYRGREQTRLKHFVLRHYLQRLAFHIALGWNGKPLVFVDGFSGPWKSRDQEYNDTSFKIAIDVLRTVREEANAKGLLFNPRCIFIESDPDAFRELENAVSNANDFSIELLAGDFESLVPKISEMVADSFALTFVDPTGWTGFALQRIRTLLLHRPGEVLINFMFDHINRFIGSRTDEARNSLDELFGGSGWEEAVRQGEDREGAIVDFYCERVGNYGDFPYVTSTRILKPVSDRSYFYLVYATRHWKGLQVFRKVEQGLIEEQERVRLSAKQERRVERSHQPELFLDAENPPGNPAFEQERQKQFILARKKAIQFLERNQHCSFEELRAVAQTTRLFFDSDMQILVRDLLSEKKVGVTGMGARDRTFKPGNRVSWLAQS